MSIPNERYSRVVCKCRQRSNALFKCNSGKRIFEIATDENDKPHKLSKKMKRWPPKTVDSLIEKSYF